MTATSSDGFPPSFTANELENSAPFDFEKRLRGEAGARLLEEVIAFLNAEEARVGSRLRRRKSKDEDARRRTVDVLLANLIGLWLNRVDATRFLAVPFGSDDYSSTGLSLKEMQGCRDILGAGGYLSVVHGFLKVDPVEIGKPFGRRTRLRATDTLIEWFEQVEVHWPSIKRVSERGVIHLRKPGAYVEPEPKEVCLSRRVLERINASLEAAKIELPAEAWSRVRPSAEPGEDDDKDSYRSYAGDETAKVLRRIFSQSWDRGGRIYGGWWMHLPQSERKHLLIDGQTTVELDYAHLHPTLLYARLGMSPESDPYGVPGVDGEGVRALGKRTFQRLLNKETEENGAATTFRAASGDAALLPPGQTFSIYLSQYKSALGPISRWFGIGEGMRLQREDSDLAVHVLDQMGQADVLTLPIHDSFIVQRQHEAVLRRAMEYAFEEKYRVTPLIKRSE